MRNSELYNPSLPDYYEDPSDSEHQTEKDHEAQRIYLGDTVICDYCNKDFTESDQKGGMLVGSWACCPECIPKVSEQLDEFNQWNVVEDICQPGETFKDFIIRTRQGRDYMKVTSFEWLKDDEVHQCETCGAYADKCIKVKDMDGERLMAKCDNCLSQ